MSGFLSKFCWLKEPWIILTVYLSGWMTVIVISPVPMIMNLPNSIECGIAECVYNPMIIYYVEIFEAYNIYPIWEEKDY